MENIQFDSGVREYRINGTGSLWMNPADPNVYARFLESLDKIQELEGELAARTGQENGVALMQQADRKMKEILNWVFGKPNDFEEILRGVNLLAVAQNGDLVVTNLFAALQPILLEGAEQCVKKQVDSAVEKAQLRREGS